jgi:hypothetical protein
MLICKIKLFLIVLFILNTGIYNSAYSKSHQKRYEIESAYFRVTIDENGSICSLYNKESKKEIPFIGKVAYKHCSIEILSVKEENETIIVKKRSVNNSKETLLTTEVFSFENDLLKWELIINPEGDKSWSTPIQTIWSMPEDDVKYRTTWGDPRPEDDPKQELSEKDLKDMLDGTILTTSNNLSVLDWVDPLVLQPLYPRRLTYGATILGNPDIDDHFVTNIRFGPTTCRNYISVPVVGLFNERRNSGVSLGFSPENIGLEACLDVNKEGELIFSRFNNRFTPGKELQFTTYIKLHKADWRASLGWYVNKFQQWFDPVNPNTHKFSGTSSYSFETGSFDVAKMKQMAYKTNWDATFPFPYMGLFLPPVEDDEGWLSWRGDYMTFKKLDSYYAQMQQKGFHVLSYFNVTEFGSNILREAFSKHEPERKEWINSNTYLYKTLEASVLYHPFDTTNTQYIYSWDRSIVVDPGEPVYADHLIDMINRYVEKLPHFEGITIDRLDWTRLYNTRKDDGVSWFNGAPARSMHISWNNLIDRIAKILHENDKVVFINNHVKRLDHIKYVDGIFDEYGHVASSINTNALLCVNKPLLGWCYNKSSIGSDFDAYMQKHLHLGMYPMAPFPANDHALRPDAEVDQLYLDYGELFKTMEGKSWILEPGAVEVVGNKAKANIFKTDAGIIIPVTFGEENTVKVTVKNISPDADVVYIHPGSEGWKKIKVSNKTLEIPLHRGCALIKIE